MRRLAALSAAAVLSGVGLVAGPPATAHPPGSSADCDLRPGEQPGGTGCTPPLAVERSVLRALEGCVVTLGGTEYGAGSVTFAELYTDTFAFDPATSSWQPVLDTTATVADIAFTPWSVQEQAAAGCVDPPGPPPAAHSSMSTAEIDCAADLIVTTTTATTVDHVYDDQTDAWVPGEPVSTTTTDELPVQPRDCPDEGVLGTQDSAQPGRSAQALPAAAPVPVRAAVPTSVAAGVAPAAAVGVGDPAGPVNPILVLLMLGGLLIGAGAVRALRA